MTETKWLTVAEASLLCSQMGLERTTKTIRSWARGGHVTAQKKSTSTGEMWVLDRASLKTKIKTEIEYRDQMQASQQGSVKSEPVQTGSNPSEPVRTGANPFEQVRTSADSFSERQQGFDAGSHRNEPRANPSERAKIRELETEIQSLRVDVGWRQKMLEKITAENAKGQEALHAQARYIGHLESEVLQLGGKPNEKFLSAPMPKKADEYPEQDTPSIEPEIMQPQRPHPDQQSFYGGHSG